LLIKTLPRFERDRQFLSAMISQGNSTGPTWIALSKNLYSSDRNICSVNAPYVPFCAHNVKKRLFYVYNVEIYMLYSFFVIVRCLLSLARLHFFQPYKRLSQTDCIRINCDVYMVSKDNRRILT